MLDAYRHVDAALGLRRGRTNCSENAICPIEAGSIFFLAKFAGTASQFNSQTENPTPTRDRMLQAIDSGGPGSVYVMQVEAEPISPVWRLMAPRCFRSRLCWRGLAGGVAICPK